MKELLKSHTTLLLTVASCFTLVIAAAVHNWHLGETLARWLTLAACLGAWIAWVLYSTSRLSSANNQKPDSDSFKYSASRTLAGSSDLWTDPPNGKSSNVTPFRTPQRYAKYTDDSLPITTAVPTLSGGILTNSPTIGDSGSTQIWLKLLCESSQPPKIDPTVWCRSSPMERLALLLRGRVSSNSSTASMLPSSPTSRLAPSVTCSTPMTLSQASVSYLKLASTQLKHLAQNIERDANYVGRAIVYDTLINIAGQVERAATVIKASNPET